MKMKQDQSAAFSVEVELSRSGGTQSHPKRLPITFMRLFCLPAAVAVLVAGSAQASVHVYEGFDYPAQSDSAMLDGGAFNGGSGLSGNWSGTGTYIYRSAGLTFSDLAVSPGSGCAEVIGVSHAFRKLDVDLTGMLWGSFLFVPIASSSMTGVHVADLYVTKSTAFSDNDINTEFGVAPKRYGAPEGDVRLGGNSSPPSTANNFGGTGLAVGTTYLVLYKVENLIARGGEAQSQTITAWLLSAEQFDNFKSGGLSEEALNAADQGIDSANVMQRTTLTATQKAAFSANDYLHFLSYNDAQGDYMYDEIRVSGTSLADVVPLIGAPTDLALSASSVLESAPLGTTVGTLSTTDTTPGDTFTYSLVSGDSSSFSISADTLRTATVFDYATQGSYNVRVRATDATGRFFEQDFTITVNPAGLTVYEGFDYPAQSDNATLDGGDFSGGSGLSGNWSGSGSGAVKFRAAGLTFSDLPVGSGSGCAQVTTATGVTAAYRQINVNQAGTLWGSFLFQSISAFDGSSKVADFYVRKNATATDYDANVDFGVAPKAYGVTSGDIRLGGNTVLPSITPNAGGTALSQNTTYLVLYKVGNLILPDAAATSQTISSWILSAEQYDHFKGGGLTEEELNAANQGSGSDNVMQHTTLTATQKATFTSSDYLQFLANDNGDYQYDEIRVSATSLAFVVPVAGGSDYDTWNATDFGAPFTDTLPASDPDNDGMTNQEEYAFGLNPTSGSSLNPIIMPLASNGIFQYTRRNPSLTGLAYTVWTSTDLLHWAEDAQASAGQSVAATHGDVETVGVTLSTAAVSGKLFVRVQAQ
jgi:hypothetical protein